MPMTLFNQFLFGQVEDLGGLMFSLTTSGSDFSAGANLEGGLGLMTSFGGAFSTFLRVPVHGSGNMRRLLVKVVSNTMDVAATMSVMVNGVITGLSVTIPPGATGAFSDDTPIAVSAGDVISFRATAPSGSGKVELGASAEYVAD